VSAAGYIIVRNWRKRQHHKYDSPPWHKVYNSTLRDDDYLSLSAADRGVLHGLWTLASLSGDGRVSADRKFLARQLNVRRVSLEPLIQAGFIEITATKRLRVENESVTTETESETEQESTTDQSTLPPKGQPTPSSKPALELIHSTDHEEINAKDIDPDTRFAIEHLLTALTDQDDGTIGRLVTLARKGAGPADFHDARQAVTTTTPRSPSRVACTTIENRLATRSTA
jgi:hypothetical protein